MRSLRQTRFAQTLVVIVLLLPFVIFQGAPHLTPAWLVAPRLGVPGTVWLVTVGYLGFVVLSWRCMRDRDSDEHPR